MPETKIFIQDSTLREMHTQLARRNEYLSELVQLYAHDTWEQVQANVKAGKGRALYPIGTELVTQYTMGATVYEMPWIVVQNDCECEWQDGTKHPGLILQSKYATVEEIQFDAPEENPVDSATEPNALEGWYYWGKTGTTYTKLTVAAGDALPFDSYDSIVKCAVNHLDVVKFGYNRWSVSAYRQWLNSDAAAGAWWTPQHDGDLPPTQLPTRDGFLRGLDADFLACVNPVKVQTACNTVTDGGVTDVTYDKIFLPSIEEIYGVPQAAGVEGNYWPYWKTITGLDEPSNAANDARKNSALNNKTGAAVTQRLRSAGRGTSSTVWNVYSGGNLNIYYAYASYRSLPACVIS